MGQARARLDPLGWGLVVGTAAVYLATACPTVRGGDNGEFAVLVREGGVAHPPGYPLFTLWLRLCGLLPVAPAYAGALGTALLGVAAVAVLRRASIAFGASPLAATAAAGVFAFSSIAWDLSTHAEVFALNTLLAGAILVLASPTSGMAPAWRAPALTTVAGLGLAHHHSIVLMFPTGLLGYGLALAMTPSSRRLRSVALSLVGLVAGLSPYAGVWAQGFATDGRWRWGDTSTLGGVLHLALRADYGTTRLALSSASPQPIAQLAVLGMQLLAGSLFVLAPVVAVGAVTGCRRGADDSRAAQWVRVSLLVTFAIVGPLFVSRFNIGPEGVGRHVVERFHLLPWACLVPVLAWGMDAIWARFPVRRTLSHGIGLALVAASFAVHLPGQLSRTSPVVEDYLRNSLAGCPPDTVVLGTGDMGVFGFLYAERGLGIRRDVTYVDPLLLHYPWYHRRISARLGMELVEPVGHSLPLGALVAQLLRAGRPVALATELDAPALAAFTIYPVGPLLWVKPGDQRPPSPPELEAQNLKIASAYEVRGGFSTDPTSWEALAQHAYARPWLMLARAYEAAGMPAEAARNRKRADLFLPWDSGATAP